MMRLVGAIVILVILMMSLGLVGCSPTTKDRWLRTLFDDPPGQVETAAPVAASAAAETPIVTSSAAGWVHAPYGADDCGACHFLKSSHTYYRGSSGRDESVSQGTVTQERTRMQAPLDVLCLRCHDDFAPAAATARGQWMHAPVASGECVICHNPHRSSGRFLLKAATAADLCGRCHDVGNLNGIPGHEGIQGADCSQCHVPHVAAGEDLLRGDRP